MLKAGRQARTTNATFPIRTDLSVGYRRVSPHRCGAHTTVVPPAAQQSNKYLSIIAEVA